jgi:hypothetical protein
MNRRYDRKAIGARASAIYREAKLSRRTDITWGEAQRRAWAEAKSPRAIERCGTRVVARIDAQQPGGVIAAMARYGISIAPVVNFAVSFGEHLTEVLHTAAVRRQRRVDALKDGGRVVELRRGPDGSYRA